MLTFLRRLLDALRPLTTDDLGVGIERLAHRGVGLSGVDHQHRARGGETGQG